MSSPFFADLKTECFKFEFFAIVGGVFNFGFLELIALAVIGLIVLGPEQFPKVARGVLKIVNELKRAFSEAKSDFDDVKDETEKLLRRAEAELSTATQPFKDLEKQVTSLGKQQEEDSMEKDNSSPINQEKDSLQKEKEHE